MRRILLTLAMTFAVLMGTAGPASAHSVAGVGGTNLRTRLKTVVPPLDGLTVKVIEVGSRLELRNTAKEEVLVLGYDGEPYLRVGPAGVFQNRRSPAVYLNVSRMGTTNVPPDADSAAPPEWKKVSGDHVARWHDHRIHWMNSQDPPAARRDPGREHVINGNWEVKMRYGSGPQAVPVVASGDLVWVPGPSALPWILLVLLSTVGGGLLIVRSRNWAGVLSATLGLLVLVDVFHNVGLAFSSAGTTVEHLGRFVVTSILAIPVWAVAVLALRWLSRRDLDGALAANFAALFIALLGGLSDVAVLYRSQAPFVFPILFVRLAVALTLALGGAVVVGSGLLLIRRPEDAKPSVLSGAPVPG
jgi:hypothetical protein